MAGINKDGLNMTSAWITLESATKMAPSGVVLFNSMYYICYYDKNFNGLVFLNANLPPYIWEITVSPSAVTTLGTPINITLSRIRENMRTRTELKIPDNVTADNFKAL